LVDALAPSSNCPAGTFKAFAILSRMTTGLFEWLIERVG